MTNYTEQLAKLKQKMDKIKDRLIEIEEEIKTCPDDPTSLDYRERGRLIQEAAELKDEGKRFGDEFRRIRTLVQQGESGQ